MRGKKNEGGINTDDIDCWLNSWWCNWDVFVVESEIDRLNQKSEVMRDKNANRNEKTVVDN